jgi:hypothetical protein
MRMRTIAAIAAAGLATGATADEFLLIMDSGDDIGRLFDPTDGSLVDDFFIDGAAAGMSTPIEGVMVEGEIWISDQIGDALYRFDPEGAFLGTVTGGMDNIRGIEYVDGVVYVSNSGEGGGAPGDAVVMFDADGNPLGSWPAGDPFDVLAFGGDLMIANIAADRLDLHQRDGEFIEIFSAPGIDFPEQVSLKSSDGNVLVGTFSAPAGVYELDGTTGGVLNYWAATGVRGVWELGNGNILFTNSSGVYTIDPATGDITLINADGDRFVSLIDTGGVVEPCYADCDESGELDFFDFLCFQNEFAAGTEYADCDESGELDFFDFLCFQNEFAAGCP